MPLMWTASDFLPWPGLLDLFRQKYEIRVTTEPSGTEAKITEETLLIDVADLSESLEDVAIASAGTRLPLVKSFRSVQNVSLTLQDDGGSAVTLKIIDKDSTGPLIKAFDSSIVATTATIDAVVQGY